MHNIIGSFHRALAACAALLFAAHAAAAYPDKAIRVILPYPPGGGGDLVLRTIQPLLEKRLGQSIVVDYRTGAAGNIGAGEVAKAAPDGYTLLMGATNNFVINQFLFPRMGFDPLQAFVPISIVVEQPYLVMISAQTGASNFQEFARYAAAHSGKVNYGSPGAGTVPHISALMLAEHLGTPMVHVPYRGSQPGLVALAANEVQLFIASYGIVAGQISSGKMRPVAVASDSRLEVLPDVPTPAELGVPPGVLLGNWWGLAAPRGTDDAIVQRISRELRAVLKDPETQRKLAQQGSIIVMHEPEDFARRMRTESQQWKSIIQKTGVKVDN
ncbi:MAG: tripartite tricarboxylate transporter substrate binding protein [Ramlibacter sp.]|nr:tripartite tricarboxylate transporter substrate binding protein [Ramlibacter sp.]